MLATAGIVVCQMAGVGILGLPSTLKQGGWIVVPLIVLCAVMSNYTGKALIRCCYQRQPGGENLRICDSYAEVAARAFGKTGRAVTLVFERMTLVGVSTIFLILAADFLTKILEPHVPALKNEAYAAITGAILAVPRG